MSKSGFMSLRYRVVLLVLVVINMAFLAVGYVGYSLLKEALLTERGENLLSITKILDSYLPKGGFNELLENAGLENASKDEKLRYLNAQLTDASERIGTSSEGLGVGFFSKELDAIITYGPSANFGHMVGRSLWEGHPGYEVMETNIPLYQSGTMVRGDILNAMNPIERNGEVIGYTWANHLESKVSIDIDESIQQIAIMLGMIVVLTTILLTIFVLHITKDIGQLLSGVEAMRSNFSFRIPKLGGQCGEVAKSINAMTDDIAKANTEAERAIAVLQDILDHIDIGIFIYDFDEDKVVYVNHYSKENLSITENDHTKFKQAFINSEKGGVSFFKKLFFTDDNTPIFEPHHREAHLTTINKDLVITDSLVTWHSGKLLHMLMAYDITERKALLAAELANKAQKEFLARISHEIRTPMNGVIGMTRLAMEAEPNQIQGYLQKIQSSGNLLLGIINDILDISTIEAGKMSIEHAVVDLPEVVDNIKDLVLPRLKEKNVELILDIDKSVPQKVIGDSLRLSQVLMNLLGNASKFTLKGSVTLKMRAVETGKRLLLNCEIKDTGIGITKEQQDALFRPFVQAEASTARKFGGTGLGLSICKALVELMGGEISVSSVQGEGSTFSFYVSLTPYTETNEEGKKEEMPWQSASFEGFKFLLAEDNMINKEIAVAILKKMGISVEVAMDGQQAVEAFLKKDYDLILMDVHMPIMNGFEATRTIRESNKADAKTIPIVAMTANAMAEDKRECIEAGMDEHTAKPIDLNHLKKIFYQLLIAKKK